MRLNENISRITPGMVQYPGLLKEIKKYPKELFCIGNVDLLKKRCVAVVGSRSTNSYGRSMAVRLSEKIAASGLVVVSGLARGIDTCAHRGALNADGDTIGVLGCGIDICYPEENRDLKREIEAGGLVISEYEPGTRPQKYFFPMRNRIISGLSEATVVVQAGNDSGALITADLAAEQGREVCAVPGNIDSQYNMGTNKLIKDGAFPVVNISDVPEMLGVMTADSREAEKMLSAGEMEIYHVLEKAGESTVDDICRMLSVSPARISGMVTVMELKGVISSAAGKIFIAKC